MPVVGLVALCVVDGTAGTVGTVGTVVVAFGISTGFGASLGGSGFYHEFHLYLDGDHNNHEISLLYAECLECFRVDCVLALKHELLGVDFKSLLLLDLILDVKDLTLNKVVTVSVGSASTLKSSPLRVLIVIFMV